MASDEARADPDEDARRQALIDYYNELSKHTQFWAWCAGALDCKVPLVHHGAVFLAEPL